MAAEGLVLAGFDRPNIRYRVSPRIGAAKQLAEFIAANPGPGIVYCPTRDRTERMAEKPAAATGRPVAAYHPGLASERRARVPHAVVASADGQIGRTSCRGSLCQSVLTSVVARSFK